ncbi:MAG: hypothetical protein ACREVR_01210, partial [Burkholderiales bacterium]
MHKFWLIFAQTATVCLAALFVVSTLRPDLLAWNARNNVVTVKEPPPEAPARTAASFRDAARQAMPSVVNIFTSQEVKRPRHPFMDDPLFGARPGAGASRHGMGWDAVLCFGAGRSPGDAVSLDERHG